jgi:Family of unknown function (DUF5681)
MHDDETNDQTTSAQAEETQTTEETQTAEETRNTRGQWQPGTTGNPKGRPPMVRSVRDVRDLARTHTTAAIETLAKVMNNPKAPPACRVAASEALLARGWGKSPSGEFEGAEALVIKVLRFADHAGDMKVIEGEVENG